MKSKYFLVVVFLAVGCLLVGCYTPPLSNKEISKINRELKYIQVVQRIRPSLKQIAKQKEIYKSKINREWKNYCQRSSRVQKLSVPGMVKQLAKQEDLLVTAAALTLGERGPEAAVAVPELLGCMGDESRGLAARLAAARTLGKIAQGKKELEKYLGRNDETGMLAAYGLNLAGSKYRIIEIFVYNQGIASACSALVLPYSDIKAGVDQSNLGDLQAREDYIVSHTYSRPEDTKGRLGADETFVMGDIKRERELADIREKKSGLLSGKKQIAGDIRIGSVEEMIADADKVYREQETDSDSSLGLVSIIEDETLDSKYFHLYYYPGEEMYIYSVEKFDPSEWRVTGLLSQALRHKAAEELFYHGITLQFREECLRRLKSVREQMTDDKSKLYDRIGDILERGGKPLL